MNFINPYEIVEIPLLQFAVNLALGIAIAVIFGWLVGKSTRLVVDTTQYLSLFLLLIPTMILIITIIKSSIALSLGLVGALSIVRFRTPIKEPEELAYIFIAIAIGLGLGANQVVPTLMGFSAVAIVMVSSMLTRAASTRVPNAYIDIVLQSDSRESINMDEFKQILDNTLQRYRFKRIVEVSDRHEVTIEVPNLDMSAYEKTKRAIDDRFNIIEISIIDNARVIT